MPNPERLPTFTPFRRDVARLVFQPFFGAEVYHDEQARGLFKFEGEILKGKGGVIVHRHFSDADPEVVFHSLVIPSTVLIEHEMVSAIQSDFYFSQLMILGRLLGVKLVPIVTRNSSKFDGNGMQQMIKRMRDYDRFIHQGALPAIGNGNILLLQPEGGRAESLQELKVKAVGGLIKSARDEGLEDFPFLFLDVRLKGSNGVYPKKLGIFDLQQYLQGFEIYVGNCMMAYRDILAEANGNWRLVDNQVVLPEMQHAAKLGKNKP